MKYQLILKKKKWQQHSTQSGCHGLVSHFWSLSRLESDDWAVVGLRGLGRICQQLTITRTWSSWTSVCGTPICGFSRALLELSQPPGLLGYYAKNSKPLELEVSKVGLGSSLPVAVSHTFSSLRVPHPTTRLEFHLCRRWDMSGR